MRRRNRRSRNRRRRFDRPLKVSIGERTGWRVPAQNCTPLEASVPSRPARPPKPTAKIRAVLAALAALPKLAASIGFVVAAQPDASVEVLAGEPAAVVFSANGNLKALFVLPTSAEDVRRALGLSAEGEQDKAADRLWEEDRRAYLSARQEEAWII